MFHAPCLILVALQREQPERIFDRQTSKSCTLPGLLDDDPSKDSRELIPCGGEYDSRLCSPDPSKLPMESALDSPDDLKFTTTTYDQIRSELAGPDKSNINVAWTSFNGRTRRSEQVGNSRAISFRTPPSGYQPKLRHRRLLPTNRETWQIQKDALKDKFSTEGWAPRKRLSPDALEGIRALHAQYPEKFTTPVLADQFQVSAESIRRILKSKWRPNDEETANRQARWDKRGERIWSKMVALGVKPPKKWRE
ncbi:MAG: hypothetical protein LQ341_006369, partial [Variospora aurantia]